ncbi:MAG TPA: hypothetical protein VNZ03_15890 [Terriglobales bacterium]|nr:hypothetical protein [Terriglobales bacterium]
MAAHRRHNMPAVFCLYEDAYGESNKLHIDSAGAAVYLRQALLLACLVASSNALPIQTAAALQTVNSSGTAVGNS